MQKHLLGSWAALLAVDEHRLSSICSSCEQRVGGLGCGEGTNEPRWFPEQQLHPRAPRAGGILPYLDPRAPNAGSTGITEKNALTQPSRAGGQGLALRMWPQLPQTHRQGKLQGKPRLKLCQSLLKQPRVLQGTNTSIPGLPLPPRLSLTWLNSQLLSVFGGRKKKSLSPQSILTHWNVNNWSKRTSGLKDE